MPNSAIGNLVEDMNKLVGLRSLLMRAWSQKQMVIIIPGETGILRVILRDKNRAIIEHPRMELPNAISLIAALVEGLEKAFEEVDRE